MSDLVEFGSGSICKDLDICLAQKLQDRIEALEAERDRLLKLVKDAYNEGFMQGMREHTSRRGGIPWSDSAIRAALSPTLER